MSPPRPAAAPGLLAALAAGVPPRLVRKLDQNPEVAEAWSWDAQPDGSFVVTTDGKDRVVLKPTSGLIASNAQISCTCLLAPRCLHLLAVVSLLPIAEEAVAGQGAEASPTEVSPGPALEASAAAQAPTADQRAAARDAQRSLADVLASGALGAGAVLQGELLRSLHACRAAGLPRLSSALLRVVRGIRDCRGEAAEFELAAFSADLAEALACAHCVAAPDLPDLPDVARWIGTARRDYASVGSLRLYGLFTQPVLTATGYAGVVTHLADGQGGFFTLADVAPGDEGRIPSAYGGSARLGGGAIAHRELGRMGLFMQGATASWDGRLGAGKGVQAVKAGATQWSDKDVKALFDAGLSRQLDRAFEALGLPAGERKSDATLLFFKGTILGSAQDALLIEVMERPPSIRRVVEAEVASASASLPFRDNLRALARCAGLALRCIGRVVPERSLRVELLAVGNAVEPGGLTLPPEWGGRCNLGLDRLEGAFLPSNGACGELGVSQSAVEAPDALLAMRRWIERLAQGGRATIFPGAVQKIEQDSRPLDASLMPSAAALLRGLARAALDRRPGDASRLAAAFLAASEYCRVAELSLRRLAWGDAASVSARGSGGQAQ